MDSLYFVKPINDIINYRKDQKELIDKAFEISNNDPLNTLQYIVTSISHEGYDVEMDLVFEIPANTEVTITLPIIETEPKDPLGYYVIWNDGQITHNTNIHSYKSIDYSKEYHVRFFDLGISGFGKTDSSVPSSTKVERKTDEYESEELSEDEEIEKYYGSQNYLTKVISFGNLGHIFTSLEYAFFGCNNNFTVPQILPSSITNTRCMFNNCTNFNQPLNTWNVSNVTNMDEMFYRCSVFNQSLDAWDVSRVTSMEQMFNGCYVFNQSLNTWNVSSVTNMRRMFNNCIYFDSPIDTWNVSLVTDTSFMFCGCSNFNQSLNNWNTSNVTNMNYMFYNCTNFNQSIADWNTDNVTERSHMFTDCHISDEYKPNLAKKYNCSCNMM